MTSPAAVATGRACRNCGATAEQVFCPVCGQATALHPPSVREFLHEFLGHYIALEGPLWRTLGALLLTPGRLTVEYFAGRRQRYIAPLRLYLTISLILFAISGLVGEGLKLGDESFQFRMPKDSEHVDVVGVRVDASQPRGDGPIDRVVGRIAAMTPAQRDEHLAVGVRNLPYALIVLVPFLALLFKLAYWKRRMLYGEHLVVALHAQTVAFIFSIFSALPMGQVIGSLWTLVLVGHGALALRRVYGGGWVSTIVRELLILLIYSIVVGLALAAVATLSLAL